MKREEKEKLIETFTKIHQGAKIMTTIAEAWFEEGMIEGEAKGKAEGIRQSLARIFAYLFQIEVGHFDEILQSLDLAALEHLHEIVFELESLAELEALLISLQPQSADEGDEEDDIYIESTGKR